LRPVQEAPILVETILAIGSRAGDIADMLALRCICVAALLGLLGCGIAPKSGDDVTAMRVALASPPPSPHCEQAGPVWLSALGPAFKCK